MSLVKDPILTPSRGSPLLEGKEETLQNHSQIKGRVWLPERKGTETMKKKKKAPISFHGPQALYRGPKTETVQNNREHSLRE